MNVDRRWFFRRSLWSIELTSLGRSSGWVEAEADLTSLVMFKGEPSSEDQGIIYEGLEQPIDEELVPSPPGSVSIVAGTL